MAAFEFQQSELKGYADFMRPATLFYLALSMSTWTPRHVSEIYACCAQKPRRSRPILAPPPRHVRRWPISEVAPHLMEVRSLVLGGLDLLNLSSSHSDPLRTSGLLRVDCYLYVMEYPAPSAL